MSLELFVAVLALMGALFTVYGTIREEQSRGKKVLGTVACLLAVLTAISGYEVAYRT